MKYFIIKEKKIEVEVYTEKDVIVQYIPWEKDYTSTSYERDEDYDTDKVAIEKYDKDTENELISIDFETYRIVFMNFGN